MIRTKKGFILQKMLDAYMIIAVGDTGDSFRDILVTNETGAFYWSLLEKGTTIEDMLEESLKRFEDLSPEAAKADIEEFLEKITGVYEMI